MSEKPLNISIKYGKNAPNELKKEEFLVNIHLLESCHFTHLQDILISYFFFVFSLRFR